MSDLLPDDRERLESLTKIAQGFKHNLIVSCATCVYMTQEIMDTPTRSVCTFNRVINFQVDEEKDRCRHYMDSET